MSWSSASSCATWAPGSRAAGSPTIRVDGVARLRGARAHAVGRLHRSGQLGGGRGHHRRGHRGRRHALGGHGGRRPPCSRKMNVHCEHDGAVLSRGAAHADQRRAHHHRPVAGISERSRQPGDSAGHAGRRRHAGPRLAVRAAPVFARADERRWAPTSSSAIRTASSSPARATCAASSWTAATSDRAWP